MNVKLLIGILMICFVSFSSASDLPEFPFVTVKGESSKQVEPNVVEISFILFAENKSANLGYNELANASKEVLDSILAMNIKPQDVVAYDVDKSQRTDRETKTSYFLLTQRVKVTAYDIGLYKSLSKELLQHQNVRDINSRFDVLERDMIEIELIKLAASQARSKANIMAEGLGVKIDSVFAFNDTGSFQSFFATFGLSDDSRYSALSMSERVAVFVPKTIEISKSVNVIYRLDVSN
jgi:uncharacterized protein YggE